MWTRDKSDVPICTVATRDHLPRARTWAAYLNRNGYPSETLYVALAEPQGHGVPSAEVPPAPRHVNEPFQIVPLGELGPSETIKRMAFQYTPSEFSTSLKPFLLRHLLQCLQPAGLLYLDTDVLVLQEITEVQTRVKDRSVIVTPHLTRPVLAEGGGVEEWHVFKSGIYNTGVLAVANNRNAHTFLEWWCQRTAESHMRTDWETTFVDQPWLDFVPLFFPGVEILKDPTWNLGYWNFAETTLSNSNGVLLADGRPVRLLHLSKFDPGTGTFLYSRPMGRPGWDALAPILKDYQRRMRENGWESDSHFVWAYDFYKSGARISRHEKRLYRRLPPKAKAAFGDPFDDSRPGTFRAYARKVLRFALLRDRLRWWARRLATWVHRLSPDPSGPMA